MRNKGFIQERLLSSIYHQTKTPVLISSALLRRFNCGQVDMAYIEKGVLYLVESKSSVIGVQSMRNVQYSRLKRSVALLSALLNYPVQLKIIAKRHS